MTWRFGVTFFPLAPHQSKGKEDRRAPCDMSLPSTYPFVRGSLKPSLADTSPDQPQSPSPPVVVDPIPPASLSQTSLIPGGRVHRLVSEVTHHPLSAKTEMADELRAAESIVEMD